MLPIFTRALELVTGDDIKELVEQAWPEGYDVEYKQTLPHKKGGNDPWIEGKDHVGEYARDEILAEVIALANGQGGTVILGIEETTDKPPRAKSITALPRPGELARRLEDQARSCIDPPLPRLHIRGIDTAADGRGVVLLRTTASRSSPHRLTTTRESYVRRGASTVRMTMREIQDMVINVSRGLAGIDEAFSARRALFSEWGDKWGTSVAFRVTAVPLTPMPDPGRIFGRRELFPYLRTFNATVGGNPVELGLFVHGWNERPIVRGVATFSDNDNGGFRFESHRSGLVDLWFRSAPDSARGTPADQDRMRLFHNWVLGGFANVLLMLDNHRANAGAPDVEYGIEMEMARFPSSGLIPISYGSLFDRYGGEAYRLDELPITFPRLSVGGRAEFQSLVNLLDSDVYDFLGSRRPQGEPIAIEWPALVAR